MSETRTVRLGDVARWGSGGTPKRSVPEYFGGEIPWLSIADLTDEFVYSSKEKITLAGLENSSAKLVPEGAILIAMYGSIGKLGIAGTELTTSQAIAFAIPNESLILPLYLFYKLLDLRPYLISLGRGGTQQNISQAILKDIEIELPNFEEQQRFVKIRNLQSSISKKRERQQALFEELSVSHYEQIFSKKEKFEWVKLGDITDKIGSGATPKGGSKSYKSEGVALIRSMNVHDRKFVYDGLVFIDDAQASALSNVEVRENDILLNITGASVARVCRAPKDVLPARVNQHVAIIRLKPNTIDPELLERYLTLPSVKRQLLRIATSGGATREALTKSQIKNLIIPVITAEILKS